MSFISQFDKTKVSSKRITSEVVVMQSYKKSTNTDEMSFRISSAVMSSAGIKIGDKVDVLRDNQQGKWKIQKIEGPHGFTISGKQDAPTGLIRYTIKDGHYKLTTKREDLPFKQEFDSRAIEVDQQESSIILSELSAFLK